VRVTCSELKLTLSNQKASPLTMSSQWSVKIFQTFGRRREDFTRLFNQPLVSFAASFCWVKLSANRRKVYSHENYKFSSKKSGI
jgi:hypothetical protein